MARRKSSKAAASEGEDLQVASVADVEEPEVAESPVVESPVEGKVDMMLDGPAPDPKPLPDPQPFPLPDDHYFFTRVLSDRGHDEGEGVRLVREWLGVSAGSEFDADALVAVQQFQKDVDMPMSGVVDIETWNAISSRYA